MASISVRKVSKRFGTTEVLRGIDVDIDEGMFAVLVGPSGCGKSTLLRVLSGLELPDSGSVHFGSDEVTTKEPKDRDIAMVFQSYALYPHLSVRENLAFGLKLRKTPEDEVRRRIAEVSEMLGIGALLDRLPKALSGGQRQRVAMGRAIVRRPAVFLFDEPLSNLDASLRAQVRIEIRGLHDKLKATSVYVTHDQVEAMTLADRLFVLKDGYIEQVGSPLEIFEAPRTQFVASFLGSPSINFVSARVTDRGLAGDGFLLDICRTECAKNLRLGEDVIVGVRPHDIEVTEVATADLALSVNLVEALGSESYAHGIVANKPFVVRLDGTARAKKNDTLPLRFRRIHVFDKDKGVSLRSAARP